MKNWFLKALRISGKKVKTVTKNYLVEDFLYFGHIIGLISSLKTIV